jgi:hypothetical protein
MVVRKRPKYKGFLFIRNLRGEVKDLFKSFCARRGVSMTRAVEDMILDKLRQEDPESVKNAKNKENNDV